MITGTDDPEHASTRKRRKHRVKIDIGHVENINGQKENPS